MPHPVQATSDARPQTLGEYRVGISFNPGGNEHVNTIKRVAADWINYLEELRRTEEISRELNPEVLRLLSLAQTHIEDAAMWAVKAVTKPKR